MVLALEDNILDIKVFLLSTHLFNRYCIRQHMFVFFCIWPAIKFLSYPSLPEAKLAHKQQSMSTISRPSPLSDWVRLTFNLPFSSISLVALGVSNNVPVTNHFTSKPGHPKPLWLAYYINNDKERHFGVVRLKQRGTKAIGCS